MLKNGDELTSPFMQTQFRALDSEFILEESFRVSIE